jgi:hypothetical protein
MVDATEIRGEWLRALCDDVILEEVQIIFKLVVKDGRAFYGERWLILLLEEVDGECEHAVDGWMDC